MSEFVGEMYLARTDLDAVHRTAALARAAAEALALDGADVRYVQSMFVPDDETFFCVYEAASADAVRAAAARAFLTFDRIAEAMTP